jgi:predicted transcriptional regulator
MAFPQFGEQITNRRFIGMTTQQMIAEVFEISVTEALFRGNRLITTVDDDLNTDALRDYLYGKKEEVKEKTEDVELLLKDLTPDERKLYDEVRDMEMGFEAATLILNKNNAELLSKNNNITIKNAAKVLNRTQKEAKVILDLLVDLGFLTRNINVYNFVDNYVYPKIGEEIEKVDETTEEPLVEETGDIGRVDTSFIDKFNKDDIDDLSVKLLMVDGTDDFIDITTDLSASSQNLELLQKAKDWLKENYLTPEYKEIIDAHQDSKDSNKQGRMTIDQSAISRLIKGCPKFK